MIGAGTFLANKTRAPADLCETRLMGRGGNDIFGTFIEHEPSIEVVVTADEKSWFRQVGEFLRRAAVGRDGSWLLKASERIVDLANLWEERCPDPYEADAVSVPLTAADARLLVQVGFELTAGRESQQSPSGLVSWWFVAADDLTALAGRVDAALATDQ